MFKITITKFKPYLFNLNFGIFLVIVSCILVIFAGGCAKLQHLDQLLTLKALSDEQTQMGKEIKRQDLKFEQLIAAVQDGSIDRYKTQKSISGEFGPPIFTKKTEEVSGPVDIWIYRYSAEFFDSPKVYLYWTQSGELLRWEFAPVVSSPEVAATKQNTGVQLAP